MLQQGIVYFARYEIKRHIATGSRSEIYSAYDRKTSRYVIIKSITAKPLTSSQSVNAIFSAAKKITDIVANNIVPVVDCCAMGGYPCVITQDINGISLKTYCEKKGKLNPKEAIAIAIQCCIGLQVLLDYDVLAGKDFYHVYIDSKDVIVSTEGKIFLNNMFMPMIPDGISPENNSWCYYTCPSSLQPHGNIEKHLVYSVGIVLYQMLTGEVPFKGSGSMDSVFQEHRVKTVPSVNIPFVDEIIDKCTLKGINPGFASVQELLTALKKALVINADAMDRKSGAEPVRKSVKEPVHETYSNMNYNQGTTAGPNTDIQAGIKKAIDYLGMDVLLSKKELINALEDLQPGMVEERDFLYRAYNNEVGQILFNAYSDTGNSRFAELEDYLVNKCGFNSNWSNRFKSIFEFLISDDYRNQGKQMGFFKDEFGKVLKGAILNDSNRLYLVSGNLPPAVKALIKYHAGKNIIDENQILMALTVENYSDDVQEGIVVLPNKIFYISRDSIDFIDVEKIYDVKTYNRNGGLSIKVHQTDNRIIETGISSRYYNISSIINYLLKSKKWG